MKKNKILYILWRPDFGGAEEFVLSLLKKHNSYKYDVTICFLGGAGPLIDEFRNTGIDVKTIGMRNGFDIFSGIKFHRFLKTNQFNLIHVHCHNFLAALCLKFFKQTPKIITEHGGEYLVERLWKTKILYRLFVSDYKKIMMPSQVAKEILIRKVGIDANKIFIVPCGIDIKKFDIACNIENKKRELGIDIDSKVVGIVARLAKGKGIHYFIETARRILNYKYDVDFLIIGNGPLIDSLKQIVEDLGIERKIKFLGWRRDIPELLSLMDLFLFTSEHEILPVAVLEAMSRGVAIVAFDVNGVSEVVKDGETGILIPFPNTVLLAKNTVRLLEEDSLRRTMGEKGRQGVELYFNLEIIVKEIENIYESIMSH